MYNNHQYNNNKEYNNRELSERKVPEQWTSLRGTIRNAVGYRATGEEAPSSPSAYRVSRWATEVVEYNPSY